ncbi:hypothetical protein KKH23_10720, partial [Patescibacteria group bacterium]|nr:hypothetical protein [Patescibacteria group bacterium]
VGSGTEVAKSAADLIILNDDIYLDKMFFKYLSLWLTKDSVLFSNSIQPSPAGGTFKPWYNWGETYENFDKNGFLKYCREIEKHESSFHTFGVVYVIHYTNWIKVNGFDEKFDPWGGGMADLMYRLFLTGVRNFSLLHDVLHYHFIRKCGKKHNYFSNITNGNITMQKITDKWNKDFKEIDNIIKEGCCYKCL